MADEKYKSLRGQVVVPFKSYCYVYIFCNLRMVANHVISDKAQECVLDWIIDTLVRISCVMRVY